MGPVRQNTIQRTVRSVHMCVQCALHCAQLLHYLMEGGDRVQAVYTVTPLHGPCAGVHGSYTAVTAVYGP